MAATQKKKTPTVAVIPESDLEAKKKALKTALAQIEKKHGEGSVMRLGDNNCMERRRSERTYHRDLWPRVLG